MTFKEFKHVCRNTFPHKELYFSTNLGSKRITEQKKDSLRVLSFFDYGDVDEYGLERDIYAELELES